MKLDAAMSMIEEVRRQFKDIPELRAALDVMNNNDGKDFAEWSKEDQVTFEAADGKAEYGNVLRYLQRLLFVRWYYLVY